jgi:hypothetical protein
VGVMQRFERRLGGLVEGAFAKVFKGGVEPVEIAGALTREAEERKAIGPQRTLVPNDYLVELSTPDYERLADYFGPLSEELSAIVREHAAVNRYTFVHAVTVGFAENPDLDLGIFRVRSGVSAPDLSPATGQTWLPPAANGADRPTDPGARLVLVAGGTASQGAAEADGAARAYPLDRDVTVIGRSGDVDVPLTDTGVSRTHGEIRRIGADDGHVYVDLGSMNGSWVNGRRVQEATLRDGDRLEVGRVVLVYRRDAAADDPGRRFPPRA